MDFVLKRGQKCFVSVGEQEAEAVKIAVANLKKDLNKVLCHKEGEALENAESKIIVGTLGVSGEIETLIERKVLCDEEGKLRKEAYLHKVQDGNLVIAGTDRRGTIYGIYDFCEMIGVSPFYFWADVPVKEKTEIHLLADYEKTDYPSVEYRGIFINDEEELETWVKNYMGENTIGVKTYEKVFELLLRLKGNYIWPAMHVNSFNMCVENGALAERMGIVVGTSHCDMLMRSNNREWKPWIAKKGYTDAKYDYSIPGRNRAVLQEYWRESVEQNKEFEVCYTLGMRGIHDSGFETEELQKLTEEQRKSAKVELLTTIIRDQQEILQSTLGHEAMMTFIPYKEVLDLYDSGMEIPEDLTLVWANDNYGYIRRYPSQKEKNRKGGNGIYYHNSYWAPPSMSYVFLCSIPLAHTGNELRKAYAEGIRKLWVLNTGAIKPLEQEIAFFLQLAWEIGKENALTEDVDAYVEYWINRTFTGNIGKETAKLLNDFSQLTNVRKVENMDYDVFSQIAYGDEAVVRIHAYEALFERGNALYEQLPDKEKNAFFQMVLMRIHAAYFTNLQYYYGDRSTLMYTKGKMQAAQFYTKQAIRFDDARRKMILFYNQIMAEGKWNGIVNPEGFPPPRAAMMPVCTPPLAIGKRRMVVDVWNEEKELIFVRQSEKWIEIGNGGEGEFAFTVECPEWIAVSERKGIVQTEKRILVRIKDMTQKRQGVIVVRNLSDEECVEIPVKNGGNTHKTEEVERADGGIELPVEEDGKLVVEAASADCEGTGFHMIKRLGRGVGSVVESRIQLEEALVSGSNGRENSSLVKPLIYTVLLTSACDGLMEIHRFPSLNATGRIRVGVTVDGGELQVVESDSTDEWRGSWKKNVLNNVDRLYLQLPRLTPGEHTIAFYPIDCYFAFSRFVIYTKERKPNNYIGIAGRQELPKNWDVEAWTRDFYGDITLKPRVVEYAQPFKEEDTLAVTGLIKGEDAYAKQVTPDWYLCQGRHIFAEQKGAIRIDAASALAQSSFAYTSRYQWQHCNSESYGRSGLAMYIRQPELKWQPDEAPALHYRVWCSGGTYTLWLLAKFNVKEEAYFGVGVDNVPLSKEQCYNKGCLWRYEAEQIYRWVPLGQIEMSAGEHEVQLYALASGLRFDRAYITKGQEMPPMDGEWMV